MNHKLLSVVYKIKFVVNKFILIDNFIFTGYMYVYICVWIDSCLSYYSFSVCLLLFIKPNSPLELSKIQYVPLVFFKS